MRPGYGQTGVGLVPDAWEVKCLGEVASVVTGSTPPTGDRSNYGDDFLFVSPADLGSDRLVTRTEKRLSAKGFSASRRIPRNSILFVCVGSTIGKCGIAGEELTSNQQINAVLPSPSFSTDYLYYALSAAGRRVRALAGEQAVPLVNKSQFCSTAIQFPPLAEQAAIAAALKDVDEFAAGLDRLLVKKRDLKQAAMQQLLTGQTRLPGFSGDWDAKQLGQLADIDPESLGSSTAPDFGFNYIALEDVDRGVLRAHSELTFARAPSRARRRLRPNDVLVSTVRPNLQSHLLFRERAGDWVSSTGFCVVRCRAGEALPEFVFAQLFTSGVGRQIETLLTGSNYPAINSGDVGALQVPVPPFGEQEAIAAVLSDMDAELEALEARLRKTRDLKQAMMQELLTGRTRLI